MEDRYRQHSNNYLSEAFGGMRVAIAGEREKRTLWQFRALTDWLAKK